MRHLQLARVVLASCSLAAALAAQCASPPQWSALLTSTEAVDALVPDGSGGFFAGGTFTTIGGTAAARIARWNGSTWSALGSGLSGGVTAVSALLRTSSGTLIAAGTFTTAGGVAASHIARWNGSSWSALGSGISGFGVQRLVEMPNGDVMVLGNFTAAGGVPATNIARWNGSSWSALGSGVQSPGGMLVRQNGELVVGGQFAGLTSFVASWNGSSWQPVGNFVWIVPNGFAEFGNGELLAAGYQSVHRWNGATWSNVGTLSGGNLTTAYDVAKHPDGTILVAGSFTTVTRASVATPVRGLARFDPATSSWSDLGSSTALAPLGNAGRVGRVQALADGRVLLHQVPALASGTTSSALAIASQCPAYVTVDGTGCSGSAGQNILFVPNQPWLGTSMTGICSAVPANALALGVWGLQPVNVPLATVLPTAVPGCVGRVFPDVLTTHAPVGGFATASLALPLQPALVGGTIRLQMLVFEGNGTVTASNGLAFTVGVL